MTKVRRLSSIRKIAYRMFFRLYDESIPIADQGDLKDLLHDAIKVFGWTEADAKQMKAVEIQIEVDKAIL